MYPECAASGTFCPLGIILRLGIPQLVIFSGGIGYEAVMAALLYDPAFVEDHDVVAEAAGGQAVARSEERRVGKECAA